MVDGVYLHWDVIVSTIAETSRKTERNFSADQEPLFKDVKSVFSVLIPRWGLLSVLAVMWDQDRMGEVVKTTIFLQNMIVKARLDGYIRDLETDGGD